MLVNKSYVFRLYPSIYQKEIINKTIGCTRYVYNYFLDKKSNYYKELNINYSLKGIKHDLVGLKEELPWLKEVDSMSLTNSLKDLDTSFTNFFEKRSEYPRFKSKGNKDSYKTNCIRSTYKNNSYSNIIVDLNKHTIKLPKLGIIPIRGYRNKDNFDLHIYSATISKVGTKYYVAVNVLEEIKPIIDNSNYAVGIDIGIKNEVITSDGVKYQRIKIDRIEKRIKGLSKALARCQKGSNNRIKIKNKIKRLYQKIRNIRKYYIHEITTKIVSENKIIVSETLSSKEMITNSNTKSLTKNILNSSFSEIIRQLKYKCKWYNKEYIQVDKYYPSSQICNHCNEKNNKVKDLNIRKWKCECCNHELDRDINASINILNEGLRIYWNNKYSL